MTDHPLASSWTATRDHLNAAMSCLVQTAEIDSRGVQEWLDHNELGLAFDDLVDLGHDRELPLAFWQHLDEAAREMNLYSAALGKPHLTSVDLCRRHITAASESENST
ncbi:MafI family immunity protein [Streptomyces sp. N2A]|uniref:MafI family immunity protein n=1 Tax=Streptomyces sp. N2A TaxID=3073936 RepID=UPI00287099FC|nr:MafI family immunity protein [Streptomyces sp. N2A]